MREAAVLVGMKGEPLYFHTTGGCSDFSIPDSRDLWSVIWEARGRLLGIAHTHPGTGAPNPSGIDLTTFSAIEEGLGRRLVWWIASEDAIASFFWAGVYTYIPVGFSKKLHREWLGLLRELSEY